MSTFTHPPAGRFTPPRRQVGAPLPREDTAAPSSSPPPSTPAAVGKSWWMVHGPGSPASLLIFGVFFPALVIGIELVTRMCTTTIFDPLPTPGHVALALALPVGNLGAWFVLRRAGRHAGRTLRVAGLANGVAIGSALYYSFLFLPLLPPALVAVLIMGLGLLPMSPLFGLVASLRYRSRLREWGRLCGTRVPVWSGVAAVVLGVVVLDGPGFVTDRALSMATSADPQTRQQGVRFLRRWGSERDLLVKCYPSRTPGSPWRAFDRDEWRDTLEVRPVFYRVTGKSFDSLPSPVSARAGVFDGADWTNGDEELRGGEVVGTVLPGLSLASSRIDGSVNADAATAYFEWTLVFGNDKTFPQEARTRVALPAGGVVSRLTLWVNGEEREAAFGGRAQVRRAYEQVVKVQRRDPVLVTTAGPDRVLMQCFPVPPGGTMKVRLGITAPLQLPAADRGSVELPCLLDRNFGVPAAAPHLVYVDSRAPLTTTTPRLRTGLVTPDHASHQLAGQIPNRELSRRPVLQAQRNPAVKAVWFDDAFVPGGQAVIQEVEPYTVPAPSRIVIAVDASAAMQEAVGDVAGALAALPAGAPVTVLAAADEGVAQFDGGAAGAAGLRAVRCVGGQDAVPLLSRACAVAAAEPDAVIVWVHGPQPVLLDPVEELVDRFRAPGRRPRIVELQVRPGHDSVLEALADATRVESVAPSGRVRDDVTSALAAQSAGATKFRAVRRRVASRPAGLPRGDVQIVRLCALDEVLRLCNAAPAPGSPGWDRRAAVETAVAHRIVTPVSGAVVLETQQQYDDAGLTPVAAVPLPPGAWLALFTAPVVWLAVRRSRARA